MGANRSVAGRAVVTDKDADGAARPDGVFGFAVETELGSINLPCFLADASVFLKSGLKSSCPRKSLPF